MQHGRSSAQRFPPGASSCSFLQANCIHKGGGSLRHAATFHSHHGVVHGGRSILGGVIPNKKGIADRAPKCGNPVGRRGLAPKPRLGIPSQDV